MTPELRRSLGLFDAVVIGLGSMIGAGIFVVLGPAADVAGSGAGLLWALAPAAVVAYGKRVADEPRPRRLRPPTTRAPVVT
ncbi:hypothetical protein STANM309S_03140 [Streptomyces tanashiensis]